MELGCGSAWRSSTTTTCPSPTGCVGCSSASAQTDADLVFGLASPAADVEVPYLLRGLERVPAALARPAQPLRPAGRGRQLQPAAAPRARSRRAGAGRCSCPSSRSPVAATASSSSARSRAGFRGVTAPASVVVTGMEPHRLTLRGALRRSYRYGVSQIAVASLHLPAGELAPMRRSARRKLAEGPLAPAAGRLLSPPRLVARLAELARGAGQAHGLSRRSLPLLRAERAEPRTGMAAPERTAGFAGEPCATRRSAGERPAHPRNPALHASPHLRARPRLYRAADRLLPRHQGLRGAGRRHRARGRGRRSAGPRSTSGSPTSTSWSSRRSSPAGSRRSSSRPRPTCSSSPCRRRCATTRTPTCRAVRGAPCAAIAPHVRPGNLVILESTSPGRHHRASGRRRPAPGRAWTSARSTSPTAPSACCPAGSWSSWSRTTGSSAGSTRRCDGRRPRPSTASSSAARCIETTAATAEMAKLAENTFRDVNIALRQRAVDDLRPLRHRRVRADRASPTATRGSTSCSPGPGVGGHCIAVDPWFIVTPRPEEARLIRTAREVNDGKPRMGARRRSARRPPASAARRSPASASPSRPTSTICASRRPCTSSARCARPISASSWWSSPTCAACDEFAARRPARGRCRARRHRPAAGRPPRRSGASSRPSCRRRC